MSFEKSKIILEYIKVAAWPIVVLFFLTLFFTEISIFIKNIGSFEAGPLKVVAKNTGTGETTVEKSQIEKTPSTMQMKQAERESPELWFDVRALNISQSECVKAAKQSLTNIGFMNVGVNNETTVYGYDQKYVGAFWCMESPRLVFVIVSGPRPDVASDKVSKLVSFFESKLP